MMRYLILIALMLFPLAAAAEENGMLYDRIDRMERDMMVLQRQLARGEPISGAASAGDPASASQDVRISQLEEEIRRLRGAAEESQFENKKLRESLEKLQKDTDFRFGELSNKPAAAADAPPPAAPEAKKPEAAAEATPQTSAGDGVLKPAAEDPAVANESPRDLYNRGFRLLNQTKYDEAAKAFSQFIKQYPKDPLVGNSYYWLGETYYIRRDYVKAADQFRQGFETLPSGPKAPDNLLKLAMSLSAEERNKEACVVLKQVVTKYKKSASSVAGRAEQEQKRIGC